MAILMAHPAAAACQEDSECEVGLTCWYARNYKLGQCANQRPIIERPTDEQMLNLPQEDRLGAGDICQFNTDCLPRMACYKRGSHVDGQCLKYE
ncbi:MAG: hypothetical protein HQL50_07990 [Magnetococcales bacterium]|nr:hypothetical protein [Magnetococcales bacterium]